MIEGRAGDAGFSPHVPAAGGDGAPGAATAPGTADGPLLQSVRVGFGVLRIGTLLLALVWATGNVRTLTPGTQAVVLRFGRVVRVQPAGLVLALPRPIEDVVTLPGGERQIALAVSAGTARRPGLSDPTTAADAIPEDAGAYLTADSGVVLLQAALTWRIRDPAAYFVQAAHVEPALRRLFLDAAIAEAAGHELDDFLAVRPERAADPAAVAARAAVRGRLVAAMDAALAALSRQGAGLGVEVTRADVTALLPPVARAAFDSVLEAAQHAEQGLAAARTDAARAAQGADRARDRLLAEGHAAASERLEGARTRTATLTALEARMDPATRPALLDQVYRERIAGVLRQAGRVATVDPRAAGRVIVSGPAP